MPEATDGTSAGTIRRGWIYGAEDFVARLVDRFERVGAEYRSRNRIEADEELAERRPGRNEGAWLGGKGIEASAQG